MKKRDRMGYIGASDAAAALGVSPYMTNVELWEEKTARVGERPKHAIMDRGNDMEPLILNLAYAAGMRIEDCQKEFTKDGADKHWDKWLRCHVDGVMTEWLGFENCSKSFHGPGIVECKAPGSQALRKMMTDGLPSDYIIQMQVMLYLSGHSWGRFLLLDYDSYKLVAFDVERNDEFINKCLGGLKQFWICVMQDILPYEEPPIEIPEVDGLTVAIDGVDGLDPIIDSYIAAKRAAKELEEQLREARDALVEAVGSHKSAKIHQKLKVSQAVVSPKPTVDGQKLADFTATLAAAIVDGDTEYAEKLAEGYAIGTFEKARQPYKRVTITGLNEFKGVV